jgi:hypothetical protein
MSLKSASQPGARGYPPSESTITPASRAGSRVSATRAKPRSISLGEANPIARLGRCLGGLEALGDGVGLHRSDFPNGVESQWGSAAPM